MKKFIAIAVAAFLLAGCSNNTTNESTSSAVSAEISSETTSSVTERSSESVSTSVEESSTKESSSSEESSSAPVETSTSSSIEEKPVSSSSNKPESSSTTKIEEKPISSSSTSSSSNKPVEKPVSSSSNPVSSSSKPTCEHIFVTETHKLPHPECLEKITKCQICGYELSRTPTHEYENGVCIWCGKYDPNVSHNCTRDGHIWGNSYTESSTENVEIKEMHIVSNNGYDFDLAYRYFGEAGVNVNFAPYLGTNAFGEGSSKVKTTGVKTITRYIHECSECGYKETYNTEETVTPGDNWVYAGTPRSRFYPVIWYDVNNIPDEIYDEEARSKIKLVMWFTYGDTHNGNNGGYNEDEECQAFTEYLITHSINDPGFNEYVMNSVTSFMNKWSETGKRTYRDINSELDFINKYTGLDLEPIVS